MDEIKTLLTDKGFSFLTNSGSPGKLFFQKDNQIIYICFPCRFIQLKINDKLKHQARFYENPIQVFKEFINKYL